MCSSSRRPGQRPMGRAGRNEWLLAWFFEGRRGEGGSLSAFVPQCKSPVGGSVGRSEAAALELMSYFYVELAATAQVLPSSSHVFAPFFGTNGRGRRGGEGNFPPPCTHAEKGVVCCRRKSKKLHRTAGRRRKRWHCWRRRTVPPPPGTKLRKSLIVRFSPFLLFQPLLALSQKGRKGGGGRNERGGALVA